MQAEIGLQQGIAAHVVAANIAEWVGGIGGDRDRVAIQVGRGGPLAFGRNQRAGSGWAGPKAAR